MDRYSSVAFPIYCFRNIIPAGNKLPQEAGFIWWFRFNYSLSSTIWNQCSWRKNACLHQPKASSESLVGKKRRSRSSLCASAVTLGFTTKLRSSACWDCRVCGPGHPQESSAMCAWNLCCNTAGHQHGSSVCGWWATALGMERLYETCTVQGSVMQNYNAELKMLMQMLM